MKQFPRFRNRGYFLLCGIGVLVMLVGAARSLFPLDFGSTPTWARIFVTVLLVCWFSIVGSGLLLSLTGLHTVRIGHGEIQICLGRLVLRRISCEQVKTVGTSIFAAQRGVNPSCLYLLVLSPHSADTLNEKGQKSLRSMNAHRNAPYAMHPLTGPFAAARAYLLNHYLGSLLWMEYSPEAEAALRQTLTTTQFLF